MAVRSPSIPQHFSNVYILCSGNLFDCWRWRLQATILKLTSNVRALYSAERQMVRGLRAALIEGRTDYCTLVSTVVFSLSYMRSWKVYGGLACHGCAKTQRGGWQLHLGGAVLSSHTSGCGLFMYVASGLLRQGRVWAWKRARLCQSYKIKWMCDAGVWLCTSCSCNWMVLIEVFTKTTLLMSRVLSVFHVKSFCYIDQLVWWLCNHSSKFPHVCS